jgi:lantibiotic transport system permease protein
MHPFSRLMAAEGLKLRRSQAGRLVWLMPLLFVGLEFWLFERSTLGLKTMTAETRAFLEPSQVKLVVAVWGGFLHPLALALLPALLFKPEHRAKSWRHLQAMPVPRGRFFLAKTAWAVLLSAFMLGLLGLFLMLERRMLESANPVLAIPYRGLQLFRVLAWLWLGSLPTLAIYLWVSDRINSLAVPIIIGLAGLLVTIALTGQEIPQPWKRDLIPWVLPYACAERVIHADLAQQEVHPAGKLFQPEPNVLRLPSGRKARTQQNVPVESLFPPPPPTPVWLLASFSAAAGLLLMTFGWLDAVRRRIWILRNPPQEFSSRWLMNWVASPLGDSSTLSISRVPPRTTATHRAAGRVMGPARASMVRGSTASQYWISSMPFSSCRTTAISAPASRSPSRNLASAANSPRLMPRAVCRAWGPR